jgi:recombination protein RecA
MSAPIPKDIPLVRARDLEHPRPRTQAGLDLTGRLSHFRGIGTTTFAAIATARMHAAGRHVAWISATEDIVYPPDLAANGVDLEELSFVFAEDPFQASRAAEHLLRSGAFGLIVLDLEHDAQIPDAVQGRLLRLAQDMTAAVLSITRGDTVLRGSIISLRGDVWHASHSAGRYRLSVRITRDKHGGTGARSGEVCDAPAGMY